jgi:hypothetical protein
MKSFEACFPRASLLFVLLLQAASIRALAQSSAVPAAPAGAPAAEISNANVIVARGLLHRNGLAGTLWILKPENGTKIRGEAIVKVTFTTRPGATSHAYDSYDGNAVELAGEVKYVERGNAVLSRVRTIGLVEYSSPAAAGVVHLLGSLQNIATTPNSGAASNASERVPYRHAYYLFLATAPHGCEACYVPLLICQRSIEEIANAKDAALCVFLVTYERDSIWEFKGAASIEASAIQLPPRLIEVNGRSYRYQEISPNDVLKPLENPLGTIPISRPYIENKTVPGASLNELVADFRALEDAFAAKPN